MSSNNLANEEKNGLDISESTMPMMCDRPSRKLCAARLGLYLNLFAMSIILFAVSSLIRYSEAFSFKTNETNVTETPATSAMSFIETFLNEAIL